MSSTAFIIIVFPCERQPWTKIQMMLLQWCFLCIRLRAPYSWNCSAISADSQCHNKCGLITSPQYQKSGRRIHSKERRGKARKTLRNTKGVTDLGSRQRPFYIPVITYLNSEVIPNQESVRSMQGVESPANSSHQCFLKMYIIVLFLH